MLKDPLFLTLVSIYIIQLLLLLCSREVTFYAVNQHMAHKFQHGGRPIPSLIKAELVSVFHFGKRKC